MSFVEQEDIFDVVERLLTNVLKNSPQKDYIQKFPRISYHDAMKKYGTDKPDEKSFSYDLTNVSGRYKI